MSEIPATLGDLADVEAGLDARLSKLERRQGEDAGVTDEKFAEIRTKLTNVREWAELASKELVRLDDRVKELERLWLVAQENPELVRELAAQVLKGREAG